MKIQKSKKIKRFVAFLLSCVMTATAIPAFELCSFAEESSELKIEQPVLLADEKGITREEWIHDLVTIFDMSVDDESTIQKYFTDTADSKYSKDIDLAANYGVFDIYDTKFNPKEFVTREFAAHTANYCIGYFDDGTSVSLKDKNKIYYEYDSIVSVQKNWFALSDGNFNPNSYMTDTEAKKILDDAKESLNGIKIDENAKNTVIYADSVVQIEDTAKAERYSNGMVIISNTKTELKADDIFVVNIDGYSHLYKAKKVTKGLNDNLIVITDETDIGSAVKKVDVQGIGSIDYDNIKYYNTAPSANTYSAGDGAVYMRSTEYLASKELIPVNINTDIGGVKVTITGSIDNIVPKFRVTKDENDKLDGFYLEASADASLKAELSNKINKEIKIAEIPVVSYIESGGVMKATLTISAVVSISGNITLSYSWGVNGGISYQKGSGWRLTKDFKKKAFTLDVKVDQSLAVKANLSAEILFGAAKGNIYLIGGEKGTAYGTERQNDVSCTTVKAHLFAEVGASFKVIGLDEFKKTYPFITEANSPLKIYKHWENDKLVPKCTYGDDSNSSTNSSKSSSPVKYSEYGSYFDGLISYENSADFTSVQTWNKNKSLTEDVIVNGDLNIAANIDLNGYTLTVTGNLMHTSGTLSVRGGLLDVKGNYTMQNFDGTEYDICYATLYMDENRDKVNVSGDFTTHNLQNNSNSNEGRVILNRGTLTIGGNIWSDSGIVRTDSGNHTTVFKNSTNQEVYINGSSLDSIKVINPEKRNIIWTGGFYVNTIESDINIIGNGIELGVDLNGHNMNIDGDVSKTSKIYLNDGKLVINGDLTQSDYIHYGNNSSGSSELVVNGNMTSLSTISISGGTLTVNGDLIENDSIDLYTGTLTVTGNLMHTSGTLYVRGGLLDVKGNYTMQNFDGTEYDICYATLYMDENRDKVNVSGDFTTHNLQNNSNSNEGRVILNRGTLTIGGNIWSDGGIVRTDNGNHTTILSGKKPQNITLKKTDKFNILKLKMPRSNYTFNFDSCWDELIESVLGDLNDDGVANVADIVMIQKYLTNKNKTIINAADLNVDGKVDVFDVVLLRRMILKAA